MSNPMIFMAPGRPAILQLPTELPMAVYRVTQPSFSNWRVPISATTSSASMVAYSVAVGPASSTRKEIALLIQPIISRTPHASPPAQPHGAGRRMHLGRSVLRYEKCPIRFPQWQTRIQRFCQMEHVRESSPWKHASDRRGCRTHSQQAWLTKKADARWMASAGEQRRFMCPYVLGRYGYSSPSKRDSYRRNSLGLRSARSFSSAYILTISESPLRVRTSICPSSSSLKL